MAYAKVEETFWHDPLVRSLTETGRHFFFYLITSPHRNRIGCYVLDPLYAAADLQWSPERVSEGVAELVRRGRISWDAEHRVVFIRRHAKHNTLENQLVINGALADLRALPDTLLLSDARAALEEYKRPHYRPLLDALSQRLGQQLPQRLETPTPEPVPQPLTHQQSHQPVTDTAKATVTVTATEASPPESTSRPRLTGSPPVTGAGSQSDEDEEGDTFAAFVDEYPEALGVLKALKHKGGKPATVATIRGRILFPDGKTTLADPALKAIPLSERVRIFAAALLEYADQGGKEWETRAIVGYMGRLHRTRGEQDREEAARLAKSNEGAAARVAEMKAREAEAIEKLNREGRERSTGPPVDPQALVRAVAAAKALPQPRQPGDSRT